MLKPEKKTNVTKKILHSTINYRIVYFETKLRFLNYLLNLLEVTCNVK
jgi:hypothetical protein